MDDNTAKVLMAVVPAVVGLGTGALAIVTLWFQLKLRAEQAEIKEDVRRVEIATNSIVEKRVVAERADATNIAHAAGMKEEKADQAGRDVTAAGITTAHAQGVADENQRAKKAGE